MSIEAQEIVIPGATVLRGLSECVQTALDAWSREWLVDSTFRTDAQVLVSAATVSAAKSGLQPPFDLLQSSAPGRLWIRNAPADRVRLARAVTGFEVPFDESAFDPWVAEVSQRAWAARNDGVCAALLRGPVHLALEDRAARPPPELFRFGSGAIQFSCEALGLYLLVDADLSRTVVPPRDAKADLPLNAVRLTEAIQPACVHLEVLLGTVDLPLLQLMDLRCGDVLRLTQRLDERLSVHCEGNRIAQAALGQSFGRTAAQVFASQASLQGVQS